MAHRIITTLDDIHDFARFLGKINLPVTVEWVQGRDRTKNQNALQWMWAYEAAQQLGDRDAADVQAEWKLRHGVPILRETSPEFRETYDRLLKPLPYEAKLRVIKDLGLSVTSIFKVRQMVRYLDAVQRESIEYGLHLTDPDPDLARYHARYREKVAA